jgi:hypothetical protein
MAPSTTPSSASRDVDKRGARTSPPVALIVGCARSGTSILAELVTAHPDAVLLFEAEHVWQQASAPADGSHRMTAADATPEAVDAVRGALAAASDGRRLVVEKNPRNSLRVPFLRAVLPDAPMVHIVRDGRDVACSLLPGIGGREWCHLKPPGWRRLMDEHEGVLRCAWAWRTVFEILLEDLLAVPHLEVRYERLVADPQAVAGDVLRFIGLELHPDVTDFARNVADQTTAPYHSGSRHWFRADHASRVGRWREHRERDPLAIAEVERIVRPVLERLGYV